MVSCSENQKPEEISSQEQDFVPFTHSLDDYNAAVSAVLDPQNITYDIVGGTGTVSGSSIREKCVVRITSEYDLVSLEKVLRTQLKKAFTNRKLIRVKCELEYVGAVAIVAIKSEWVISNNNGDSSVQNEEKNENLGAESVDKKLKSAKSEALRGNLDAAILVLNHYRYVVHDYEKAYFWGVVVDKLRPGYADNLLAGIRGDIESECFETQEMEGSGTTTIPDIE
ncbi:hypothetical protein Rhal01_02907 [Rubritalea halochordaticola]|uniref:Uncharacterized protein n=2 Tax=Rubritalea halochordaticola TaxID=714537 RepID=A0ABP9V236_9BACT